MKPNKHPLGWLVAGSAAMLIGVGGVACTPPDDSSTSAPEQTSERKSEQKDLLSFKIDDRSAAGLTDVWVVYELKNHSSKKSDYSIEWEAVDPSSGKRLANSTEYVDAVQPGQTTTEEMFTSLKTADVKINITGFDRMESY